MNDTSKRDTEQVDQNELRTTQFMVIGLLLTAYVLDRWELVAVLVGMIALMVFLPALSPFDLLYRWVLRPLGLVRPDMREDHMAAHRFARLIGLTVVGSSAGLLYAGYTDAGWALAWLVVCLGSLALLGWCAGCFMYYMLNRLGLRGLFPHAPPAGSFPGSRPPKADSHA